MQLHKTVYVVSQSVDTLPNPREAITHFLSEITKLKMNDSEPCIRLLSECPDVGAKSPKP